MIIISSTQLRPPSSSSPGREGEQCYILSQNPTINPNTPIPRVPLPLQAPPPNPKPTMPSTASTPSIDLPPYVLLEVFEFLPGQDLVVASHTCRLWNQLIMARRRLRANAFLPSTYVPSYPIPDTELHPIISQLHLDDTVDPSEATYGRNKPARRINASPVATQLATCPAVTELRLDVMKYHPHVVVANPDGVRVADVVRELAK
jgi:hypothetical protein